MKANIFRVFLYTVFNTLVIYFMWKYGNLTDFSILSLLAVSLSNAGVFFVIWAISYFMYKFNIAA
jgi:hypothetical protein